MKRSYLAKKRRGLRQEAVVGAVLIIVSCHWSALAIGGIELTGDVLELALPIGAGGATLGLRDWQGTLELGESEGVTIAATEVLKYSLDTRRPNGGDLSFPSEHASIS